MHRSINCTKLAYFIEKGSTLMVYDPNTGQKKIAFESKYIIDQFYVSDDNLIVLISGRLGNHGQIVNEEINWNGRKINWENKGYFNFLKTTDGEFITDRFCFDFYNCTTIIRRRGGEIIDLLHQRMEQKLCLSLMKNFGIRI